jgi:hypothetical protein
MLCGQRFGYSESNLDSARPIAHVRFHIAIHAEPEPAAAQLDSRTQTNRAFLRDGTRGEIDCSAANKSGERCFRHAVDASAREGGANRSVAPDEDDPAFCPSGTGSVNTTASGRIYGWSARSHRRAFFDHVPAADCCPFKCANKTSGCILPRILIPARRTARRTIRFSERSPVRRSPPSAPATSSRIAPLRPTSRKPPRKSADRSL